MKLSGSVCIVTGSATGVGAACAVMLAKKGARVVVNFSRSEDEARQTLIACQAAGAEALLVQGNVANDSDCRRIAEAALKRWGRIDGLVNNAGVTKFANPADLDLLDAADFHRLLDVNVIGAFQMTRAVVPAMRTQGRGAIVNVSSNATAIGGGSSVAYTASKGALNAMTLTLARVLAPEIRVNAVSPGVIESRWLKNGVGEAAFAGVRDRFADTAVLGRVAQPEDVAEPIVWLLEGADYVTGEILMVAMAACGLGQGLPSRCAPEEEPRMKRLLVLLVLLVSMPCAVAAPSNDEAVASAKEWLTLIDAGDYAASWTDASTLFEESVDRDQWVMNVGAIRKKLGPLQSRQYQSVALSKTLQGAPDGDYATVSFQSAFANRAKAGEVITLVLENGHWRAGGYFIK